MAHSTGNSRPRKSKRKLKRFRPEKPYPDFPLHAVASGQWCCRIDGKIRYFGKWAKMVQGKLQPLEDLGWEHGRVVGEE